MKLTTLLLIVSLVQVSAATFAQRISLSEKNVPITKVLTKIKSQTGYDFVFTGSMFKNSKPISIEVQNAELDDVLKRIFDGQAFEYIIEDKSVVISKKTPSFLDKMVDAFTPPIDISGVVLDEKGAPLVGATVKVKGLNQSTTTDAQGRFSLPNVDDKAVLVITFIGYTPKEVAAKASLSVSLKVQPSELQEVVVAYGRQTQQSLTGAVTVVTGAQIQNMPNRSFDKSLQGLVPGLQVTNGTGQPGGGVSNIVLRGIATSGDVNTAFGARTPLFIIDGVPVSQDPAQILRGVNTTPISNPLAQLNPSDIESISVLKDASAIALYGSKASNGVILVTTKKGKSGRTVFNVRHQTDFSKRLSGNVKLLNQEQYLNLLYETYKNTNAILWTDNSITADLKSKYPIRGDGSFYPAPDWDKEIYNDNAITNANEFSMSGGNEKNSFYLNFEYTKQDGVIKKTDYDRKSIRINFENRASDFVKLGVNASLSYNLQNYSNAREFANESFGTAMISSPLIPNRLEDGSYRLTNAFGHLGGLFVNPVAQIEYNLNRSTAYRGLTNFYGDVRFLKNFTFHSNIGADFSLTELKEKNDPRFSMSSASAARAKIAERDDRTGNLINTNTLNFSRTIDNDHAISILVGQEAQILTSKSLYADAGGNANTLPYYDQLSSPGYSVNSIAGNNVRQTLLSIFGQTNYGFQDKYFFTASLRRDGASRFGNQEQWGTYWSTGLGWVASNETWLKDNTPWLNYLKIRGSIGAAGNSAAVNALTRFDRLLIRRYNGGNAVIAESSPGNPDIKWEQTLTWDAGLELRTLNNRLSLTTDLYERYTKNLIYTEELPSVSGYPSVLSNIGDMKNRGVEFSVNAKVIQSKKFYLTIGGNWSSNVNKLIKANIPLTIKGTILANEEGRNYDSFYMPVWAGVNPADGKPQWLDANGAPTSTYNNAKKQFVGKPQPDGFGSITTAIGFRNIEVSAQLYYQYGTKIYNDALGLLFVNDGAGPYGNQSVAALNYWKKPGDISTNPRRLLNNTDGGNAASTRYLFNGDYLRLQNVTISYRFPIELLSHLHLSGARIYLQGNNLLTMTKYSGPDPDNVTVGGNTTGFAYPIQKSFSFGINLNF